MAYQGPEKGGHAIPQGLMPLDEIMLRQLMPIMRELYTNFGREYQAHKQSLQLLQSVSQYDVAPDQIAVTDEGWSIRKPRPQADATQGKSPNKANASSNNHTESTPLPEPITLGKDG